MRATPICCLNIFPPLTSDNKRNYSGQVGSASSQYTWLETRVGLYTASETSGGQFDNMGYNMEVIIAAWTEL